MPFGSTIARSLARWLRLGVERNQAAPSEVDAGLARQAAAGRYRDVMQAEATCL